MDDEGSASTPLAPWAGPRRAATPSQGWMWRAKNTRRGRGSFFCTSPNCAPRPRCSRRSGSSSGDPKAPPPSSPAGTTPRRRGSSWRASTSCPDRSHAPPPLRTHRLFLPRAPSAQLLLTPDTLGTVTPEPKNPDPSLCGWNAFGPRGSPWTQPSCRANADRSARVFSFAFVSLPSSNWSSHYDAQGRQMVIIAPQRQEKPSAPRCMWGQAEAKPSTAKIDLGLVFGVSTFGIRGSLQAGRNACIQLLTQSKRDVSNVCPLHLLYGDFG